MNCVICGAVCYSLGDKRLRARYYRCNSCNFIFKDRNDCLSESEEKSRYDMHKNFDDSYIAFFGELISIINTYISSGNGLDFGSGPYPMLYNLLSIKYKMNKFDKYYDNNIGYKKYKYDFITMTEVIEHLSDPILILKELVSLLKNDGLLFIMTEFSDDKEFVNWWYHRDATHISFFSFKTFKYISKELELDFVYSNKKNIVVLRKCINGS